MKKQVTKVHEHVRGSGGGGAVYGLGLIGALIYNLQHASTFIDVVIGILQALVWPAFLVYHLLGFLHM